MHPWILGQKGFPLSWGHAHLFLGNHPKWTRLRVILSCGLLVKACSGKSLVVFLKMSIFLPVFASLLMELNTKNRVCCYESLILNRASLSS